MLLVWLISVTLWISIKRKKRIIRIVDFVSVILSLREQHRQSDHSCFWSWSCIIVSIIIAQSSKITSTTIPIYSLLPKVWVVLRFALRPRNSSNAFNHRCMCMDLGEAMLRLMRACMRNRLRPPRGPSPSPAAHAQPLDLHACKRKLLG